MAGGSWEVYKDSDGWVKLMYSREDSDGWGVLGGV